MRRTNYLNVMLTINAVLMTAVLWTTLAGRPILSSQADAQSFTRPTGPRGVDVPTIPNAAKQRFDILKALRAVGSEVEATNQLLSSGRVRVEVTNLDRSGQ